ncbi:MAG: threonine ammonia-lyase [Tissierellia bacterium]|nr:threonine ammonia-lyase [Tissierellia bacterium]
MIRKARETISPIVQNTPIFTSQRMAENLFIKMENLQKTGSFKIRGAYNKIANLTKDEAKKGVIACSAGNHAQGVAISATAQGIKSYITIPSIAPLAKIDATRQYGGEVIIAEGLYDDAYELALKIQKEKDLTFVHPFNDEYVMAGQGTIGLEILEELPDVKYIIVPIGGGGLISGIAVAVKEQNPNCKIIGVQTELMPSMKVSVEKGELTTVEGANSLADGILVKTPGDKTFEIVKKYVDDIVTVSEDEIALALLRLLEEGKVSAEGAGAASIAAVLAKKYDFKNEPVCAVLSGGNINIMTVSKIIKQGLFKTGRLTEITTKIPDRPGELIKLLNILKEIGCNILNIEQYTEHSMVDVNCYVVRLVVETFNCEHQNSLYKRLEDEGYSYFEELN